MKRLVLAGITPEEFERIESVINYFAETENSPDLVSLKEKISAAPKKNPITIPDFSREEFRRMIILTDVYNVIKTDNVQAKWDDSLDVIYQKLNKKYLRLFREEVYSDPSP